MRGRHQQARFWIALSYVGNGPQEAPAQWVISVADDPGINLIGRLFHKSDKQTLAQLRERTRTILQSNVAIKMISVQPVSGRGWSLDPAPMCLVSSGGR